nr:MAG TPA: hypothetical protein [Caudoviricetes sp.]
MHSYIFLLLQSFFVRFHFLFVHLMFVLILFSLVAFHNHLQHLSKIFCISPNL